VSDDDAALLLAGVDSPQPLPERLREHFEQALIGPQEVLLVFHGIDAARPIPSDLHDTMEQQLRRRHRKTLAASARKGRRERFRARLRRLMRRP